MANAEHLELLKQGVEIWNHWRAKNPDVQLDLRGAHQNGVDLREADLRGANLREAILRRANLSRTDLHEADLRGATLIGADLIGADLREADLRGADLRGANLREANLSRADLSGVTLNRATLNGANLREADLSKADLIGTDLSRADLREANLSRATLSRADFREANLSRATLSRATLYESDLREATLIGVDFHGAALRRADFGKANLRQVRLSGVKLIQQVNFTEAQLVEANCIQANLREVMLLGSNLQGAYLQGVCLQNAYLVKANLRSANLSWARLQQSNLTGANLSQAILCDANLTQANLLRTDLAGADLRQANLKQAICEETQFIETKLGAANFYRADATGASFYKVDAIGVDFQRAILTGACIEDWNINSATNFKDVVCEHIYLKENSQERRPHGGGFQPGEFTQRFQKFLETVDLFFVDGVDWKAFLTSFQDLQSQYGDENLAVQGIERKGLSSFEIRLAVPPETDKAEIERVAYARYEINLKQIEAQYRAKLAAKDIDIQRYQQKSESLTDELLATYRQQNSDLTELVKLAANRPITVEATAVADNSNRQTDLRGAQFAGGFAETVQGSQSGGTINNYGPNTEDITRLLTALRNQAQTFPPDQQNEALDTLEALQDDLAKPEPDHPRIGRRLKKLVTLDAAIALPTNDFTTSGALTAFISNVIELTEKLGIPVEQVQPPSSGNS